MLISIPNELELANRTERERSTLINLLNGIDGDKGEAARKGGLRQMGV
jgi:hypothetical protein